MFRQHFPLQLYPVVQRLHQLDASGFSDCKPLLCRTAAYLRFYVVSLCYTSERFLSHFCRTAHILVMDFSAGVGQAPASFTRPVFVFPFPGASTFTGVSLRAPFLPPKHSHSALYTEDGVCLPFLILSAPGYCGSAPRPVARIFLTGDIKGYVPHIC